MNTEALFLFLILLLGLVLCSFLGGSSEGFTGKFSGTFNLSDNGNPVSGSGASTSSSNKYDNYNHFTGNSTRLSSGATYYGPQGNMASVFTNSDGSQSLQIVLPGSSSPTTFNASKQNTDASFENFENHASTTSFIGPNGSTATIVNTDNGQNAIKVTTSGGTYYYNVSGEETNKDKEISSTQYYGSTGYSLEPNNQSVTSQNTSYSANNLSGVYSSTLPPGIPKSQIPSGKEDLYILKTQVVPPVCPACSQTSSNSNQASSSPSQYTSQLTSKPETCPPCPACARCPESSFECKKVPNYNAINSNSLPAPVLADFSQFGM
jgi:hypothetical protein